MSTFEKLQTVFQDVFEDDDLIISPSFSAVDLEDWDSLMHVTLVLQVETEFAINFTSSEVSSMGEVADMLRLIEVKRAGQ